MRPVKFPYVIGLEFGGRERWKLPSGVESDNLKAESRVTEPAESIYKLRLVIPILQCCVSTISKIQFRFSLWTVAGKPCYFYDKHDPRGRRLSNSQIEVLSEHFDSP